jgi:hypothetical protein
VCISINDPIDKVYVDDVEYLSRFNRPIINIVDTSDIDSIYRSISVGFKPYIDKIYLLMEKGPVRNNGTGWKMTNERIKEYVERYQMLASMSLKDGISTRMDECVWSILNYTEPNCIGGWIEVNSYMETRLCPYSVDSGSNIEIHRAPCRLGFSDYGDEVDIGE